MTSPQQTGDVHGLAVQGRDHATILRALVDADKPDLGALAQALATTRGLRAVASLIGFDALQGFLGRLLQVLEDVESASAPWSRRLCDLLRQAVAAEEQFLASLDPMPSGAGATALLEAEGALAGWRREQPLYAPRAALESLSALRHEAEALVCGLERLQVTVEAHPSRATGLEGIDVALARAMAQLQNTLRASQSTTLDGPEQILEGLRNHCEGGLRHLVEAAAQEVLDEARERGVRLALRVTGSLDPVDEALGAALLEVLSHLWSDCLDVQSDRPVAEIDTVLRSESERLVVEIGDPEAGAAAGEDDVLGRHPGLRHTRPLLEALHGLVRVQPADVDGCRFQVTLPLAAATPHCILLRVGRRDIAVPASGVEAVHATAAVPVESDAAGAYVRCGGTRVPILHLAFLLGDVAYDELVRENVVIVGSFERRAALFASRVRLAQPGRLQGEPHGPWAGAVTTPDGDFPLLGVGALLGRCPVPALAAAPAASRRRATVLVVDSSEIERERLRALLLESGHEPVVAASAQDAWTILEDRSVDMLVCDLRLPEMNAQQLAERRRRTGRFNEVPVLLVLSHAGDQSHLVVQQLGATAWVRSPLHREELLAAMQQLVSP